jgi:hypothetical protein
VEDVVILFFFVVVFVFFQVGYISGSIAQIG